MTPVSKLPVIETGLTGNVRFYDRKKGWGRITADDGRDIYVHHTGVETKRFEELTAGDLVSFDLAQNDYGLICVHVEMAEVKS